MENKNILSCRMEDYLKTIFIIQKENGTVRIKDLANALGVKMPSISEAVKGLKKKGMVNYQKKSAMTLTDQGRVMAEEIILREETVKSFLESALFVEEDRARAMASDILHCIDNKTSNRLKKFTYYLKEEMIPNSEWKSLILRENE